MANRSSDTFRAESEAEDRWHQLARIEGHLFWQKSRIQWLALGDQNTRFYHNFCQERTARNNINILFTEDVETLTEPSAIKREAVNYFQRFMQSLPDSEASTDMVELQDLLSYRCSTTDASMLVAAFTPEEIIHKTLLSLPNGKVPGPYGYTKDFFVAVWPIVGRDLVIAIQSFFQFGFLPTGVNSTILTLIPKKTPAQTDCMLQFDI